MSTLLADSINYRNIPSQYKAAGYVDGYASRWPQAGWDEFPDAIRITVLGNDADAADVERYDMTPDMAGPWARRQRNRGLAQPKIYVDRNNGPAVESSLDMAGFSPSSGEVALWIATLDGTMTVTHWDNGQPVRYPVWAVQYANANATGGGYDLSIVYEAFGAGTGSIEGGLDMATADQILAAVTMPLPKRPDFPATYTDDYLMTQINDQSQSWTTLKTRFNAVQIAYMYALSHRTYVADALVAMKAEIDALKTGTPVDLSGIEAQIATIQAAEDAIKVKLDKDLA